jgi:RNA polymerase sigma factor (sigma-70 family)
VVTYQGEGGELDRLAELPVFERAQAGCQDSLQALMDRHDGLVRAVVRQQYLGALPFGEALQAGRIGLWRAIVGFDTRRGRAFSTYAWPSITHAVWRAVKTGSGLRPPPRLPFLPDAGQRDPAEGVEQAALRQAVSRSLNELLRRLPDRLRQIVLSYYGLSGETPASYRQLGARLGLSHERVRQLHTQALVWLRHPAHSQALRTLLQRHTLADYETTDALAQRWLQQRAGRYAR